MAITGEAFAEKGIRLECLIYWYWTRKLDLTHHFVYLETLPFVEQTDLENPLC